MIFCGLRTLPPMRFESLELRVDKGAARHVFFLFFFSYPFSLVILPIPYFEILDLRTSMVGRTP